VKQRLIVLPFILLMIPLTSQAQSQQQHFFVCKSTYALCTTAKCTPIPGKPDVSCACDMKTGYSLGAQPCEEPKPTPQGEAVRSRYYPVKSYARCSNDRPWAYCLDMPCIVDKNDKTKAACTCSLAQNQGDYVVAGEIYTPSSCTTGILSSATVADVDRVTDYLKTQDNLHPFDIKVLNEQGK
jgi:hypothetical protein